MALEAVPLYDHIIARRANKYTETEAGLAIPDSAQDKPQEGIVVAVGPGRRPHRAGDEVIPLAVKVGDRILFGQYAGVEIVIDDQEVIILREDEILVIMKGGHTKPRELLGIKLKRAEDIDPDLVQGLTSDDEVEAPDGDE